MTETAPIRFALGRSRYDNRPKNQTVESFTAFCDVLLREEGRSKIKGGIYATAAMSDAHRCAGSAEARRWIPLDLDGGISAAEWRTIINETLPRWSTFAYLTASATPEAPRARIIIELDREATRDESMRVGPVVASMICAAAKWDASVYRHEQPVYLPLRGAMSWRFNGDPLAVDDLLNRAPAPAPRRPLVMRGAAAVDAAIGLVRWLYAAGLVIGERGDRLDLICPWADEHSGHTANSATSYFLPSAENGFAGGFRCLHSHCAARTVKDLFRLHRESRRAAA